MEVKPEPDVKSEPLEPTPEPLEPKPEADVKPEPDAKPEPRTSTSKKRTLTAAAERPKRAKPEPPAPPALAGRASTPSEAEIRAVHAALCAIHPEYIARKRAERADESGVRPILDALVGTILSQNTTDVNSHRAFASLKAAFPTWEEVRTADPAAVEESIRSGGLAATKTARIQIILNTLHAERGECSLEFLRSLPNADVVAQLRAFKGVGAKTAACVLLFAMRRPDFAVDTHVWKIAMALGWVPKSFDRDQTYEALNVAVPDELKFELHVLLVEDGKVHKNGVSHIRAEVRAMKSE